MKSLLQEFTNTALTKSDGSDAGKNDVVDKTGSDVKFSLMRNTINADGEINGSDVANYLEKAGEINDEIDSVVYGLETDDGEVVKVYVNATQADAFEAEMKKMLGMEDDIEEAINELATKFDIVDVIWPKGTGPAPEEGSDDDVDLDSTADIGDPNSDAEPVVDTEPDEEDEMEVIASSDEEPAPASDEEPPAEEASTDDEAADEEPPADEAPKADKKDKPDDKKGDKKGDKHSKLSTVGNKMKVKEEAEAQGANMSIGNKFLTRVLAEATEDRDGVIDGYDITLDAQQRALAQKLRAQVPKKIVHLFAMIGIPGNKLNSEGAEQSISDAAEMLRGNLTVRRAFNAFFDQMATAYGKKITEPEAVQEAKLKRGNYLQKQLETILVKLGLPEALVSTTGPGIVGTALYKASKMVEDSAELKSSLRMLAIRMGIKPSDAMAPLEEAVDPMGADMYADAVMALVATLGVPDAAFARNARMILANEFRNMRKSTNVSSLAAMIKQFDARFATAKARVTREEPAQAMGTVPTR